jgi:hypothetical protein
MSLHLSWRFNEENEMKTIELLKQKIDFQGNGMLSENPADRERRADAIIGWLFRYFQGGANPKWLDGHAAELAYYILKLKDQEPPIREIDTLSDLSDVPLGDTVKVLSTGQTIEVVEDDGDPCEGCIFDALDSDCLGADCGRDDCTFVKFVQISED